MVFSQLSISHFKFAISLWQLINWPSKKLCNWQKQNIRNMEKRHLYIKLELVKPDATKLYEGAWSHTKIKPTPTKGIVQTYLASHIHPTRTKTKAKGWLKFWENMTNAYWVIHLNSFSLLFGTWNVKKLWQYYHLLYIKILSFSWQLYN